MPSFSGGSVRILIVEDDYKIAAFIVRGLKEAGYASDHVESGEEGLQMAQTNSYDAAIVDIMLPGVDGLTLIEQMRRAKLNLPVLILSAKRSVDDRIKGFQKGGDDYITKPFSFAELLVRIQSLIRRASLTRPHSATDSAASTALPAGASSKADAQPSIELSVGDLKMNLLTRVVTRAEKKISLQPREFSLLEYLMRNADYVLSKTMIMEHVWDYDFDPQTNVVDVLVSRLRTKVDKGYDKNLIHTIRGVGYVLREDE